MSVSDGQIVENFVVLKSHNLKVVGSKPNPATMEVKGLAERLGPFFLSIRPNCSPLIF